MYLFPGLKSQFSCKYFGLPAIAECRGNETIPDTHVFGVMHECPEFLLFCFKGRLQFVKAARFNELFPHCVVNDAFDFKHTQQPFVHVCLGPDIESLVEGEKENSVPSIARNGNMTVVGALAHISAI
jgi:hypothetical protein